MVFIYPLWWTGLPAMLQGYVEEHNLIGCN
ncbi:NAD(P)H-dependent oxidoreductase [Paenibacillus sp. Soil787]